MVLVPDYSISLQLLFDQPFRKSGLVEVDQMERNLRREDVVDRYAYDIRIVEMEELLETLGTNDIIE